MDELYCRSRAKNIDVECNVCSKKLIQLNYEVHINRHSNEECMDLLPRDQRTLISFFQKPFKILRDATYEHEVALITQSFQIYYNIHESGNLSKNEKGL